MPDQTIEQPASAAAEQLRPVVITVVLANLAVFALLMTTINMPAVAQPPMEIASAR